MSLRLGGRNPLSYIGVEALQPPDLVVAERNPISGHVANADYRNFNIGTFWLNSSNLSLWFLAQKPLNTPIWIELGIFPGTPIETISGNVGGPQSPIANNFAITTANATAIFTSSLGNDILDFGIPNLILGSLPIALSGTDNVGLGALALGSLTSGNSNVAIGTGNFGSLGLLTIGQFNTAIGSDALSLLISGNNNVVVGDGSGVNYLTNESRNIIIGAGILGTTGESNTIRIGLQGTATASFMAGVTGVAVANQVPVVINSATGQLGVAAGSGAPILSITGNDGLAATPTLGNINIVTANATVKANRTATSTETIDFGLNNLGLGNSMTSITSGANNTGLGLLAGNALTTGSDNTFIGWHAGSQISGGINNVALGSGALAGVGATLNNSVAIGNLALNVATAGANVAIGYSAAAASTTAVNNVFIGALSGLSITSGSGNIGCGSSTLAALLTGAQNVALGLNAGNAYSGAESSNIVVNSQGVNGESHTLRIGSATGSGTGELTSAFISGIVGNTVTGNLVNINTATNKLGNSVVFTSATAWTPVLAFGGASVGITYGTQTGTYSQIGNVVFFNLNIVLTNKGSSVGNATITGLPVSALSSTPLSVIYTNTQTAIFNGEGPAANIVASTISLIKYVNNNVTSSLADTDFTNTSSVQISGTILV